MTTIQNKLYFGLYVNRYKKLLYIHKYEIIAETCTVKDYGLAQIPFNFNSLNTYLESQESKTTILVCDYHSLNDTELETIQQNKKYTTELLRVTNQLKRELVDRYNCVRHYKEFYGLTKQENQEPPNLFKFTNDNELSKIKDDNTNNIGFHFTFLTSTNPQVWAKLYAIFVISHDSIFINKYQSGEILLDRLAKESMNYKLKTQQSRDLKQSNSKK